MSKRPRPGEGPSNEAPPAPASGDGIDAGALAGWVDQKLREQAANHVDTVSSTDCGNPELYQLADEHFDEFLESLEEEQMLKLPEARKGEVAQSWRMAVADATRLVMFTEHFSRDHFCYKFAWQGLARHALRDIKTATEDNVDKWFFDMGHNVADEILNCGVEPVASDTDDSDDPVDESESEEEGEEEESSEEGSGDGSASGSEEGEEGKEAGEASAD